MIGDLEAQIRQKEDYIIALKREIESLRVQNGLYAEQIANLQAEIDALNAHIRILQKQNVDLTSELDHLVQDNESIRSRLDRKQRVESLRAKCDQ